MRMPRHELSRSCIINHSATFLIFHGRAVRLNMFPAPNPEPFTEAISIGNIERADVARLKLKGINSAIPLADFLTTGRLELILEERHTVIFQCKAARAPLMLHLM